MIPASEIALSGAVAISTPCREYVRGARVVSQYQRACHVMKRPVVHHHRLDDVNTIRHIGRHCPTAERASAFFEIGRAWFERKRKKGFLASYQRENARTLARRRRRHDTQWRCIQAMRSRPDAAVIFATLTFPPEYESLSAGTGWQQYRRKFLEHCPDADYICVLERAGQLHLHVLWITSRVPEAWMTDPMRHKRCTRRELSVPKSLWPFGFSSHMSVRFNRLDYFGKRGHHWPNQKSGEPVEAGSAERVAGYVSKYLTKDHGDPRWRTRMSRGFGLRTLKHHLSQDSQTVRLVNRSPDIVTHNLPPSRRPSAELVRRVSWQTVRESMTDDFERCLVTQVVGITSRGRSLPQTNTQTRMRFIRERCGPSAVLPDVSSSIQHVDIWYGDVLYRNKPHWLEVLL